VRSVAQDQVHRRVYRAGGVETQAALLGLADRGRAGVERARDKFRPERAPLAARSVGLAVGQMACRSGSTGFATRGPGHRRSLADWSVSLVLRSPRECCPSLAGHSIACPAVRPACVRARRVCALRRVACAEHRAAYGEVVGCDGRCGVVGGVARAACSRRRMTVASTPRQRLARFTRGGRARAARAPTRNLAAAAKSHSHASRRRHALARRKAASAPPSSSLVPQLVLLRTARKDDFAGRTWCSAVFEACI